MRTLALATILIASMTSAGAETKNRPTPTINDLLTAPGDEINDFMADLGRGIESANMWLKSTDAQPIYCPPDTITLSGNQYHQILNGVLNDNAQIGHFEVHMVGLALIHGLRKTFPCSN